MKLWLVRDEFGFLYLHQAKPQWEGPARGWVSYSPKGRVIGSYWLTNGDDEFTEDVTFENSPKEVELNLVL